MPYELRCACNFYEVTLHKTLSIWDADVGYPRAAVVNGREVVTVALLPATPPCHSDLANVLGHSSPSPQLSRRATKRLRSAGNAHGNFPPPVDDPCLGYPK